MKTGEIIFVVLATLMLALVGITLLYSVVPQSAEAILIIDFGDGHIRRFRASVEEVQSARDFVYIAGATGHMHIVSGENFHPISIDGHTLDDRKEWVLSVNGFNRKSQLQDVKVSAGDVLVLKYE